jgi:RNA polymerase sigma-70 factor (ECF subfamily)
MRTHPTGPLATEPELLAAARDGDEDAFGRLIEPYRARLHAHCYRMLGSLHDAEDALQEALLRAWRGIGGLADGGAVRPWLYRIATNTCLDAIAKRPKRVLPVEYGPSSNPQDGPGEPLVESVWIEPYPDERLGVQDGPAAPEASYEERESVELAFVAALQHLSARQRAVLILREVLGFSAQETGDSLETSVASVNSALQRARAAVSERAPQRSQQVTLRALGDRRLQEIVDSYMEAMGRGDVAAVVSMLAEDAAWSMPPLASWYGGPRGGIAEVEEFLRVGPLSGEWNWRHLPARANAQPAIGVYSWDDEQQAFLPFALDVLTLEGERIKEVTAFIVRTTELPEETFRRWPDQEADSERVRSVFERFGLPIRLD